MKYFKKTDILIKQVKPEDVKGILEVSYKAWLQTYPNKEAGITLEDIQESYKDVFTEDGIKKRQEKIKNISENEKKVVAKYDNQIIGFATMVRNENNNQLRSIYILPEFQGKGIGLMLWDEVKKFCDPTKDIIVQVATYNKQAIDFYNKLGFKDTGKRFTEDRFRMPSGAIIPEMEMVIKVNDFVYNGNN